MKNSTRIFSLLVFAAIVSPGQAIRAQSILNPADPIVTYNSAAPPTQPAFGTIGKWVRTKRMSWNTDGYKAYIYKGNQFRLYFPKSYNPTAVDGKKYPMFVFYHGVGEAGTIYDNEYSLYHGGQIFANAVANGIFDGYILVMQTGGGWGPTQYGPIKEIMDYMVTNNKLDPFHVCGNGLSGGGGGTWNFYLTYPTYNSAIIPMSAVSIEYTADATTNLAKYTPIWNIHGGLDGNPAPYTCQQVNAAFQAKGANYTDLNYTDLGHGTWDRTWAEPNFWPFINAGYAANPWTLFGRTQFCPGNPINLTVGLQPGFAAYQWRKNGTVITGATSNTINVTSIGTYDARVQRGGIWSDWSHIPVVISIKPPTVTPPITVSGTMSKVIPAPDGNTGVSLTVPGNYVSYIWQKVGSTATIGTGSTLNATTPGDYKVQVTEQFGCSSNFSPAFTVISANGPNKPDAASGLNVAALSLTSLLLNWSQNPSPVNNETNFEVYQGTQAGGPYKLVAITGADVSKYTLTGLKAGTKYYYIVRAVNNTGAATASGEASGTTIADVQAPTAPSNLTIPATTRTSVALSWGASTDNVGVTEYDVYINGAKSYVVPPTQTQFTVYNLQYGQTYTFVVKAVDPAGNNSPASNQVTGQALSTGLTYKFYPFASTPSVLPNFSTLTPTRTGASTTTSLTPATQANNYSFLWEGFLHVTQAGTYNFSTSSDDGSKLYLGVLNGTGSPYNYSATALVSNDGLHGIVTVNSANVTLSVGVYPIAIVFFQGTGGVGMTASWKTPGSGSYVTIPASAFGDVPIVNGQPPATPSNLVATSVSYNKISLRWTDNSNNETGFEVWRSSSATTGFITIGATSAGVTSFTDSTVAAGTRYYYQIRAIGQYGQSAFSSSSNAITQALPAVPAAPTIFSATAASSSAVNLSWTNNAVNATNYQVYRSANNNQSYVLWAVLPATAISYKDTGLFANAVYYYQVRAINAGGNSAFAPEKFAKTLDNPPVITKLSNQQVRYGITTTIPVSSTHVGGGAVVLTSYNLPSFAQLTGNGNGTGVLTLIPAATNQGSYNGLSIIATDAFGGADTTHFNLVVNDNYPPTIDNITGYTMNENDTLTIPLSAHDLNAGDVLTLSVSNLPNTYTLVPRSNGIASLLLHPGFAAAGVYTVQVKATDNKGAAVTRSFMLTVKNKDPNTKIFSRFAYQDAGVLPTQWNALLGATTTNLKDSSGSVTSVGLVFSPTTWWNTFNGGSSTGNNSGVYPDAVLQDYYWYGSVYGGPDVINGSVTGVDTSQMYSLTFYANSVYNGVSDNGTSTYTANGQTVSLYVQNNKTNTVTINNIKPAANGTIAFSMGKTATTPLGYINALVITKHFDDGTAPAPASALAAQRAPGQVSLSWTDAAYNATGYQVWRAPAATGVYSLLGTAAGNTANSYVDSTISGNTKYYYTVRAYNGHGASKYSDTVTITTANRLPKINAIANVSLKNNQRQTINVTTVSDPTARLRLMAANLPPFTTFVDNGNGTGVITIAPTAGTVGVYPNVTVTVADQVDSTASTSFTLAVTEPNVQSVYVNFTGVSASPKPWNTLTTPPFAGTVMSNLVDDSNNPTTMSLTMPDGFNWFSATGWNPGNNDGVYPPSVMKSGVYEPTTATRRLQIKGLSTSKLYNFVFFNSQQDGTNGLTNFTINGQTVSLNAMFNINKTVQINGIAPDASGLVTISVAKGTGAANAYLSSVVIQSYAPTLLLNPTDLRALVTNQASVKLQWQDRSAGETGFEVWRASASNGTYSKIATLAANVTTYTDGGLTRNTTYYYIVRAVKSGVYSDYSSVLPVTTYSDAVYVNVNSASKGNAPWNNLNQPSAIGLVWNNFVDSTGNTTSISMTQTQGFAGLNSLGMVTGNNSGVYPDAVIMEDYVAFQGQEGAFQLSGLNLSKTYDLTFFGSENLFGDNTTAYIVNGDTVFLNAMYNSIATVTMRRLVPDNTGRLTIKIRPYGLASGGGWINAMVIQGYNASAGTAPTPPQGTGGSNTTGGTGATAQANVLLNAYPNPFHQFFTLSVPASSNSEKVQVTIYDMAGRLAYMKEFSNLIQGDNYLRVDADQHFSQPGVYIIKVVYADRKTAKTFKLIKQ